MLLATKKALDENEFVKNLSGRLSNMSSENKNTIIDGAMTFRSLCANCHGADGKGLAIGGSSAAAPPLVGAIPFKYTEKNMAIRLLLNGLSGPVNGRTYPAEMPAMAGNSNNWIASVLSYTRYEFGNIHAGIGALSPIVTPGEVDKIRQENKTRNKPWTLEELKNKK